MKSRTIIIIDLFFIFQFLFLSSIMFVKGNTDVGYTTGISIGYILFLFCNIAGLLVLAYSTLEHMQGR